MSPQPASDEMARQLRTAWFTYLDTIEPVRPALYRYCRHLTRDLWEAEDLLQETLLRGFGAIGAGRSAWRQQPRERRARLPVPGRDQSVD